MAKMDTGSVELFSENDEETNNGGDWYSSESDYVEEDEPALPNSAPLFSNKQPRPRFFSEKGREDSRSRSRTDSGYYEEWLKRRGNVNAATRRLDDAQTPSGRPQSHVKKPGGPLPRTVTESDGPTDTSPAALLSALGELNNTVNKLVQRMDKQESRLESMEEKLDSTSLSSSSSECKSRTSRKVPVVVRSETRKVYQTLLEEDSENFSGFCIGQGTTFRDAQNQRVVTRIVKEVQGVNPSFIAADIRSAVYTYYKSLCQEQSLQRRGVSDTRKKQRRRRERISRKLQERQAVFQKLSYAEKDREKWQKVFSVHFMSSEESDGDDAIKVHPLPWRSNRVSSFFHSLDEKSKDEKSPQAKRQMKGRCSGTCSTRTQPSVDAKGQALPSWLFKITA